MSPRYKKLISVIWQISQNQSDILKKKIQFFVSELLSSLAFNKFEEAISCLEGLNEFLYLATCSGRLRMINYEILRGEIERLKEELNQQKKLIGQELIEEDLRGIFSPLKEKKVSEEKKDLNLSVADLSPRQLRILEIIKERKKIKSTDLFKIFPDVSPKTLRFDLRVLLEREIVFKQGTNRNLWYFFNPKFSFSQENPAR